MWKMGLTNYGVNMFATLISIAVGILGAFFSFYSGGSVPPSHVPMLLILPFSLLLLQMLLIGLSFVPLQKAEQNFSPRILELVQHDPLFRRINILLALFVFLSITSTFMSSLFQQIHPNAFIVVWLILLGLSIDMLHLQINKIFSYLNPFKAVKMFTKAAKKSIAQNRELDLCDWIDSLSEAGIKSLHRSSSSLCSQSIDEMRELMRLFLESSKSIAHGIEDTQTKTTGGIDKVSYTLFYFYDRLAQIFKKALSEEIETICSAVVLTLGKMTTYAAKYDLSLATYPIQLIGDLSHAAEEKRLSEVAIKGTITLLESARIIIEEVDLTYQELQDPFLSMINQFDEISKETFKRNKDINIKVLTQPLEDLKALFQSEKMKTHQDTPVIVNQIDRVLNEWETLQTVLRTMPIPPITDTVQ